MADEPGGEAPWAKYIPKQGTGIAGRMSTVAMVALIALGVGVYSMPKTELKLYGVLVIAGLFVVYLVALVLYAWMNPLHASLEGAPLLQAQLRQWEIAEKD